MQQIDFACNRRGFATVFVQDLDLAGLGTGTGTSCCCFSFLTCSGGGGDGTCTTVHGKVKEARE